MSVSRRTPSYADLRPASAAASAAAKASSAKRDTTPELALRRALWARGLRYRVNVQNLPGCPDIVFRRARTVVFCDGDFWHGRRLKSRLATLSKGHNAPYWVAKIRTNVERDRRSNTELRKRGWLVLRYWETDVAKDPDALAAAVDVAVRYRRAESFKALLSPKG